MRLEIKNLSLRYGTKKPLFEGVNLTVDSGDFVLIHGPSGSGKSSFLRLPGRLQEPASGEILLDGLSVRRHNVTELRANGRLRAADTRNGRRRRAFQPDPVVHVQGRPRKSDCRTKTDSEPLLDDFSASGRGPRRRRRGNPLRGPEATCCPHPDPVVRTPGFSFVTNPRPPSTPSPNRWSKPGWNASRWSRISAS